MGKEDVSHTLNNYAMLLHQTGRYHEAEVAYRQALALSRKFEGNDSDGVAKALGNPGAVLDEQRRPGEAEPLLMEALALSRKREGGDGPHVATILNSLANVNQRQNKVRESEQLFRELAALQRKLLGDRHPNLATALNGLGLALHKQGRDEEAEPYLREAVKIENEARSAPHPQTANIIGNLGRILEGRKMPAEAEACYREALAVLIRLPGDEHPDVVNWRNRLAINLKAQTKWPGLESLYREILAAERKRLGENHPDPAATLGLLASVLEEQKKPSEAEKFYPEVLQSGTMTATVLADGKIVVAGARFPGAQVQRVVRFFPDGTLDPAFEYSSERYAPESEIQQDGKILLAFINSANPSVVRLLPDGRVDNGFNPSVLGSTHIALQPDGEILLGNGPTMSVNGGAQISFARLHSDGTPDTSLPQINTNILDMATQPDGKIIIAGAFTMVHGVARKNPARLFPDGSLDTIFNPNPSNSIYSVTLLPDGKILAGGGVEAIGSIGGTSRNRIARLHPNGTVDAGFNPTTDTSKGKTITRNLIRKLQNGTWRTIETAFYPGSLVCSGDIVPAVTNTIASWQVRTSSDGGNTWTLVDSYRFDVSDWTSACDMTVDGQGNFYVVGPGRRITTTGSGTAATKLYERFWIVRKGTAGGTLWQTVDTFAPDGPVADQGNGQFLAPNAWPWGVTTSEGGDVLVTGMGVVPGSGQRWITRQLSAQTGTWTTTDEYIEPGFFDRQGRKVAAEANGNFYTVGLNHKSGDYSDWIVRRKLAP